MDDRWQSVDEITEYLGVSRDTIYTWLSEKGLPGHRIGRLWKFKREEVDDWVRAGGTVPRDTQSARITRRKGKDRRGR